jgi:hypothetical protein
VLQPSKLDEHLAQLAAEKTTTPTGASSADAAGKQGDAARTPLRPTALELTTLFLEKAVEKVGTLRNSCSLLTTFHQEPSALVSPCPIRRVRLIRQSCHPVTCNTGAQGAVGPLEPAAGGDDGDGLQLPTPDAFSKRQQCLLRLAARVAEPAGLRSLAQVRSPHTHMPPFAPHRFPPRGGSAVRLCNALRSSLQAPSLPQTPHTPPCVGL